VGPSALRAISSAKFVTLQTSLIFGDPFDDKTELGPLSTADAGIAEADVAKTVQAGARCLQAVIR